MRPIIDIPINLPARNFCMCAAMALGMLLVSNQSFAQGRQLRVGSIPKISMQPRSPASKAEEERIKALIQSLAEIDSPDFGLSGTMSGRSFAPVAGSDRASVMVLGQPGLKRSSTLTELVKLGPKALPFLLNSLTDATPTKLTMKREGILMNMWYGRWVGSNQANKEEERMIDAQLPLIKTKRDDERDIVESHQVNIGDVCFVAIGQIVNRSYSASLYIPSGNMSINSPTHDPIIAKQVRAVWSRPNAAQTLFDSLMLDYHTEERREIRKGNVSYVADDLMHTGALMRLLYYYPHETVPLIVKKLGRVNTILNIQRSAQS